MEESVRKTCIIRSLRETTKRAVIPLGIIAISVCICWFIFNYTRIFTAYNIIIAIMACIVASFLSFMAFYNTVASGYDTEYYLPTGVGCFIVFICAMFYSISPFDYPSIIFEMCLMMLILVISMPFAIMYSECFRGK